MPAVRRLMSSLLPIGPDVAEQIGLPADYGVLIERVLPDGGAAEKSRPSKAERSMALHGLHSR